MFSTPAGTPSNTTEDAAWDATRLMPNTGKHSPLSARTRGKVAGILERILAELK
jgi:hypothetical protein